MWSLTGPSILDHDQLQMRMFFADFAKQSLGGISSAIVFVVSVLLDDRFRRKRNHLFRFGMDMYGPEHLMVVSDFLRTVVFPMYAG